LPGLRAPHARETRADVVAVRDRVVARGALEVRADARSPADGRERVVIRRAARAVGTATVARHPDRELVVRPLDERSGYGIGLTVGRSGEPSRHPSILAAHERLHHRLHLARRFPGDGALT